MCYWPDLHLIFSYGSFLTFILISKAALASFKVNKPNVKDILFFKSRCFLKNDLHASA
jgi:hypothetical protein